MKNFNSILIHLSKLGGYLRMRCTMFLQFKPLLTIFFEPLIKDHILFAKKINQSFK